MRKLVSTEMTPEDFVKVFSAPLEEYLQMQFRTQGHVLDMMAAAGEFYGVSYHSISALLASADYTQTVTTKE